MNQQRRWLWAIAVSVFVGSSAYGQQERFDLGKRLRAFESAWEDARPDDTAKKRALEPLKRSVSAFLLGRQSGVAGRALDEAQLALLSADEPSPNMRWAAALSVRPKSRLIDATEQELPLELVEFYPSRVERPVEATLRLTLQIGENTVGKQIEAVITHLPQKLEFPIAGTVEGDYWLKAEILVAGRLLSSGRQMISRVTEPAKRLTKLNKVLETRGEAKTTEIETLKAHRNFLNGLHEKQTNETDCPAMKLFGDAEALAKALETNSDDYLKNRRGESCLTLSTGNRATAVRLFAPEAVRKGKPMPLVVALHGAGGSENMFFEGYGNGAIVKACRERGWLLVAPRSEGLGFGGRFGQRQAALTDVIDEIARYYPVDRERVFLVGHSMGAGQAVFAATQASERFHGVAALGGGSTMRRPETVNKMPFFVGCGSEDFALSGTQGLARSLQKVEGGKVALKEYANVEHLTIVQVALPDVFAFFDELAKSR